MDQDIKTVILKVNGEDAEKELQKINSKLEDANKRKKELYEKNRGKIMNDHDKAAIADIDKEISQCNKQLRRMAAGADEVTRTLNKMEQATPRELNRTLKSLKAALSGPHMQRGSKEWKAINEQIKKVKEQLQKVNAEQQQAMSMSDRFAEWGNKWMGIAEVFETTAESLSGVKMAAAEAYQAFLDMDEAMVAVKKYTGLSADSIKDLNETFKQMDTRTPREKLNALAADAGRLGITSKEAIVDFVTAANMINVALGEDLGEDAVKNIGKLAQLFGDDEKMGLKQAMISTGSVINDLAQSSSANEGYIMDFTARLAGMAKQANMSQAQVMALASVMDQAMVNAEEGSTALMKVIQQIYREPQKIAKAAGMDVEKFTELVKTDANEALLQFATAVSNLGGMEKIAPMLGDLSLTGAGVSKAIATLANNVDKVRASQQQANEAFRTGASVVNEYNTANNSATAQAEKAKKQMQDLRIELGEKLAPIMTAGLGTTKEMIKAVTIMLDFSARHLASIIALTATIVTFEAVANRAVIAEKAMALWAGICDKAQRLWAAGQVVLNLATIAFTKGLKAARVQFQMLNATMKTNVFGLVAAAIAAVVVGLVELINRQKEATSQHQKSMDALQRANKKAVESSQKDITRVQRLVDIINSSAHSYDTKKRAMLALQKIVPGFHAAIGKEITLTKENTKAIGTYIKQLENKAKAEAYYEELVNANKALAAAKRKEAQKQLNIDYVNAELERHPDKYKSTKIQGQEANAARTKKDKELAIWNSQLAKAKKEREMAENTLKAIKKQVKADKEVSSILDSLVINGDSSVETTVVNGGGGGGNPSTDKIKQAAEQQKMALRMKYQAGIIDYQEYNRSLLEIEMDRYAKERDLYTKDSAEWIAAENKRLDLKKEFRDQDLAYSLNQIEVESKSAEDELKQRFARGKVNYQQYEDQLNDIHLRALKRKAVYYLANDPGSPAQIAAQEAYQSAVLDDKISKQMAFEQKVAAFQKEYNKKTNEEKKADELKFLDELVKAGVIAEEDKQKYIKEIQDKYRGDKKESSTSSPLGGPSDPISSAVINIGTAISNLQQKLKDGEASWKDYAAVAVASLGMISTLTNSASQLMQANIDVETAKINKKYDVEINKAGRNSRQAKKLEEKRQAEIAKVKNKYASKAMAMQMAGAVAQTAVSAINAYSSAAAIPLVGHIIAPIAAAAAVAAGMIQIATIRKQHEAQMAGYYSGGYTGGSSYHREAGVVHQGEFVANHDAVNNPRIRPVLDLLDYAQQHNTVSSLDRSDVSAAIAAPQRSAFALDDGPQTIVISETQATTEQLERLNDNLEKGTVAKVVMDDFDNSYRKFQKLKSYK